MTELNKKRLKAGSGAILAVIIFYAFTARYEFGVPPENTKCIDGSLFIIDKYDTDIKTGDTIAFYSKGMEPYFPDGNKVIKFAAGVGGDFVSANHSGVYVNSTYYGQYQLAKQLGIDEESLYKKFIVPEGKVMALGDKPVSYDSRYWGLMDEKQVYGKAYAIW